MTKLAEAPLQADAGPLTVAAGTGFRLIVKLAETGPLPHALVPLTVITPALAEVAKLTVMELVLLPDAMVTPDGNVQV